MYDWKQIEEITGHKIVYVATVGSRAYGLEHPRSDYDYGIWLWPGEVDKGYEPFGGHVFPEVGRGDCFFKCFREIPSIATTAGIWPALSYSKVIYAHDSIKDFLMLNQVNLSNMSLYHTYATTADLVQRLIKRDDIGSKQWALIVRESGVIRNVMKLGSVYDSAFLDGDYLEMYWKIKKQNHLPTKEETCIFTDFLFEDSTKRFFGEFLPNRWLYEKFCEQLVKVRDAK